MPARRNWLLSALLAIGVCGMGLRFWLAKVSIGSDDASIWFDHAQLIATRGVGYAYTHPEFGIYKFNHPPLMGYWSVLALSFSGGDLQRFSWGIKAPGLLVELLTSFLVWRIWSKQGSAVAAAALAAYATCLASIEVSGFHGNTDSACAGLTLLAFYVFKEKRRPFLSGLVLALALNVKIIPLLVVPVLLAQCHSPRDAFRFCGGLSLALVPFLPFVLIAPPLIYSTVFAYNPSPLEWGLYHFLESGDEVAPLAGHLSGVMRWFIRDGRYLVMLGSSLLGVVAFFKPTRFAYHLGAAALALFLVLTPGFAAQYTVYVVPLLFAADYRRAAVYGLFAGLMITFIYTARMQFEFPLRTLVQYYPIPRLSQLFGVLAWGSLVGYLLAIRKKLAAAH